MAVCLIDTRCLQDPAYAERGIGRHSQALLERGRTGFAGGRLIGIVDPALPPLSARVRAMLDDVRVSAYTGAIGEPACFIQLSPMTHDPLFTARLLHHPAIPCAAVIYDFIPLDQGEQYLPNPAARIDYHIALRWLARYDLFLPISGDAANRLRQLLVVPEHRIEVTGAPLAAAFERLTPMPPRHVLVVGGGDPRKNPECVVRAHARTRWLQEEAVPLVITGNYPVAWTEAMRGLAASLGGDPGLVRAAGHLDEAGLHRLYAGAICVVTPSRAEGFSLPVVEAMAAGVPALASDIPAHRELLDRGLFGPDDDGALAQLLMQARDPAWRAQQVERQQKVWPRFRADAVAGRFWSAVARLAPAVVPSLPASVAGRRPVVALLTPLPPDRTGVADYSAATCAELSKRVELHVFTPTAHPVSIAGVASVNPLSALPLLSSRFDRVVGVLGNSVFHLDILRLLLRYGGAALLHDGRMVDLYAGHIGLEKTERLAEAEIGRKLRPNEIWTWLAGDRPAAALLLAEIASVAEPLLMHARAGVAEVGRRYGRTAIRLPFSLQREVDARQLTDEAREAARRRLRLAPGEVVIASFGYLHPTKAPFDCVWALDLLHSWGLGARLVFVGGSLMETAPLVSLAERLGVRENVQLLDEFVDEGLYRDYLAGADLAVQLRMSGPGSMSGAVSDCVAAGLPTVASEGLLDGLDAPDYVWPVPDNPSPVLVAEALLAAQGGRPTERARVAYAEAHDFAVYSEALCAALGLA